MKKMIRLLTLGATVAVLGWPTASSAATIVQDQCTEENKAAWYATFRETFKTEQQPKAHEAAKKYLAACTEETDITKYLKRWVTAYEKEIRKTRLPILLYNEKKYAEAFQLGREILADEPENLKVLVDLGYGGYLASSAKNNSFNTEALNYARKAIQMIESGKTLDSWTPFPSKDEALAFLHYYIGTTTLAQDPSAALPDLIKAAKLESSLKRSPLTYDKIATAYEAGPYAKQSADYKTKFGGKDETPESKLALENINQVVDRMIDAYARAVASAGSEPNYQVQKKEWQEALKTWYKYRHKDETDETGMNQLVAGILAKPLPPEPTPLTSLPVSAPAATPASAPGAGNGTTGNAPGSSTASTTTAKTTTANTQPATKPATTPANTTTKPAGNRKPRRNHRN